MSVFDIDYEVLVETDLPVRLRAPIRLAWLDILVSPVVYEYGLFTANRGNNLYILGHSSQVCYMEASLNDIFDPTGRTITIVDAAFYDAVYTYLDDELKPVFIDLDSEIGDSVIPNPDPVPLYTDGETYLLGVNFIVQVPSAVTAFPVYDLARLKAIVDMYRLPGKNNYSVVIV